MILTIKTLIFFAVAFSPIILTIRKQMGGKCQLLDFDYTNCLRGVAILLIMTGHIAGTMGIRWFTPFGGIGVALFLFLSGYGCNESYKYKGLNGFWGKKVKRVLLPYAIVITLVYVYKQKWDWNSYLLNIIGLRTSFWFIAFMMKWYIVFWVTTKFLTRHRMLIMFLCSFLMLTLLPKIEAEQAFSFLLGVICSEKVLRMRSLTRKQLAVIVFGGLIIGGVFLGVKQLPIVRLYEGETIYTIIQLLIKLPIAVGLVAALALAPVLMRSRYLMTAGIISYELFLVHFPFYSYLNGILIWAIVLFVGSFIVAYGFYQFNVRMSRFIR